MAADRHTVAIMQPTYLPWCGYMAMLDQADVFILDDTADVNLKSWQMRNRIRTRDGHIIWLSIPTTAKRGMPLNQVEIVNNGWQYKHIRTIDAAYRHTPGYPQIIDLAVDTIGRDWANLTDLTTALVARIAQGVGITTPIYRASTLGPTRPRMADRITDLCHRVGANVLLNTPTAQQYLDESMLEAIQIEWHDYQPTPYQQAGQEWASHLSIIDLIAHSPTDSLTTIRGNPTGNLHSHT